MTQCSRVTERAFTGISYTDKYQSEADLHSERSGTSEPSTQDRSDKPDQTPLLPETMPGDHLTVRAEEDRARPPSVVVVDDDEWVRRGLAEGVRSSERLHPLGALDHAEAAAWNDWRHVDVALVDAYCDGDDRFDRFPGVGVVERIRRFRSPAETLVIVISGHLTNDLLRLRMAEAGADFFYGRNEVRNLWSLEGSILHPESARRADRGDPLALARHGLRSTSRLNCGLAYLRDRGLGPAFGSPVRDETVLSRRRAISVRAQVADMVGIRSTAAGSGAFVERVLPSWRQVFDLVNEARGNSAPPLS